MVNLEGRTPPLFESLIHHCSSLKLCDISCTISNMDWIHCETHLVKKFIEHIWLISHWQVLLIKRVSHFEHLSQAILFHAIWILIWNPFSNMNCMSLLLLSNLNFWWLVKNSSNLVIYIVTAPNMSSLECIHLL